MIFVTGYFGAPIREEARRIASRKGWQVLDLDAEIEKKDGRSIARLCMMGGEHAYRNAEFEAVRELQTDEELVVICGDGILYDEDTRGLILQHELVIAGEDLPWEALWENAQQDEASYHAFMKFGTQQERQEKFAAHHARQKLLFAKVRRELAEGKTPAEGL